MSGTRTCCQLSPRKTANERKPTKLDEHLMYIIQEDVFCLHSVNVRALKERQRGSVFVVLPVLSCSCAECADATAQRVILYVAAFTLLWCAFFFLEHRCLRSFFLFFSWCAFVGFFYETEFLACLRGFFSCSAVSSIQLEVIPVPRILVAVVRQLFFS